MTRRGRAGGTLLTTLLVLAAPAFGSAETVVFAGSGSNLPIVRVLAREYARLRPDVRIEVPNSIGSTGGVRAAADRAVAVGLVSRELREADRKLGLTVRPYAATAVVIAVHPRVPETAISAGDLRQMYRGTKSRWRDGQPIVLLTREAGDSSIELLDREVPGFREAYRESEQGRRARVVFTDQQMHDRLANTIGAIGLSDLGAIASERLDIKPLALDGVAPTVENAVSGLYRLEKSLSFVYRETRLRAAAKDFVAFALSSDGARILRAHAYWPVR